MVGLNELLIIIGAPVILIGLPLLLRPVILWYFRINTMVEKQDEMIRLLGEIAKR